MPVQRKQELVTTKTITSTVSTIRLDVAGRYGQITKASGLRRSLIRKLIACFQLPKLCDYAQLRQDARILG